MKTWEDMFEINRVEREDNSATGDYIKHPKWLRSFMGVNIIERFEVKNTRTGETIGEYKDYDYARKQARYKFKRAMKEIEKLLISV